MDEGSLLRIIETAFRILLGLRFLNSGISNVIRWPHAIESARIAFPVGAPFFGFMGTSLLVLGGIGLALGLQTHVAGLMIVIFLIPTLKIQRHWLQTLPASVAAVKDALKGEEERGKFQLLARHAIHAHETGWQTNLLLIVAALYFSVRGCIAFGLDNLLVQWVIRFI